MKVRRVDWADAPPKGDAADFLERCTPDEARALIAAAQPYVPEEASRNGTGEWEWREKPIDTLSALPEERKWILEGYIAREAMTNYTAYWKGGKTTWLSYLFQAACRGDQQFIGRPLNLSKMLIVTEESESRWAERRDELRLTSAVSVLSRPFFGSPDLRTWERFVQHLATRVDDQGYDLIVIDPIQHLWNVKDENSAAQVKEALLPFHSVMKAGAAVLIASHPSKSDQGVGRFTRGSGVINAFVDIFLEMRSLDDERPDDTRRVLDTKLRWDDKAGRGVVIELHRGEGYTLVGDKPDMRVEKRLDRIEELLAQSADGLTVEAVHKGWEGESKPGVETFRRTLEAACARGAIERVGTGKRGDPYRYRVFERGA